jgi:hypothetical protein
MAAKWPISQRANDMAQPAPKLDPSKVKTVQADLDRLRKAAGTKR